MAELTKQTEYYKEEFRQYCNKYVSLRAKCHSDPI